MPELEPNRTHNVPIDATGEVATFRLARPATANTDERLIEFFVDGTAAASYQVEFGNRRAEDFHNRIEDPTDIKWYTDPDYVFTNTADVSRSWYQAMERVRIVVTTAATAGATADITISEGL